jgi:ribose 5-phosphate isomerase B
MKLVIGSDHGGIRLKAAIVRHLEELGHEVKDIGPFENKSVDYPSYAFEVCRNVTEGHADLGILCCGTGIGMSMAANKVHGIRAAVVSDCFSAEMTRQHNNCNVLCLGERVVGEGLALKIVDSWMNAEFEGDRHQRRVDIITEYESNKR